MRLHDTAKKKNKAKYFVRINGDSPMIDPRLIDKAIKISQKQKGYDIITNTFPELFQRASR